MLELIKMMEVFKMTKMMFIQGQEEMNVCLFMSNWLLCETNSHFLRQTHSNVEPAKTF